MREHWFMIEMRIPYEMLQAESQTINQLTQVFETLSASHNEEEAVAAFRQLWRIDRGLSANAAHPSVPVVPPASPAPAMAASTPYGRNVRI